jgi:alkyl sulfatase BDS1-like metallo-beta-lactamase superfamily hydrolase
MPGIQDFRTMSDEQIFDAMALRLSQHRVEEFASTISFYQLELTRRTIADLRESSRRLETLTKVLIGATVILLLVALPPAVEVVTRLLSR